MRFELLALAVVAGSAAAQDSAPGRVLYETYCGDCHYERIHKRQKSDVKDLSALRDSVAQRARQTRRAFTLDELEAIVQYLNESHYRFKPR